MACQVETNSEGKIIDVKNEKGQSSTLFKEIFNVPILTLEQSLEIYQNTYSEKVKNNKEYDRLKGNIYTSIEGDVYAIKIYDGINGEITNLDSRKNEDKIGLSVVDRNNNKVASMGLFKDEKDNLFYANIVNVKEEYRRQGVASSLYQFLKNEGIKVKDSEIQTEMGKAFKEAVNTQIEPSLIFQTPAGEKYNNYQEALQNTSEGDIELRANDVIVAKVNADTSIDNYNGLLNHLAKQGILRSQRILDVNGDQLFIPSGETDSARQLSANIIEDILNKQLGASSYVRFDDGSFTIEDNLNTRIINGEKIKESEISDLDYEQLKNRFNEDSAIEIMVEREFEKGMLPSKLKRRIDEDTIVKTEDELTRSIKTLLNKVGVNITSIEDYEKHYSIKNGGVNPSASALMDIMNKIIAFRDETITNEDLIEETMHLIEASLDPTLTADLRANIHLTPEWREYSKNYYDIYSKEYSGEKIEEMVRREILGKVMANGVATNFQLSQEDSPAQISIFQQIVQLLDAFFAKVNAYFTNSTQQQINQLNKDIYVKLLSGELADELDVNQNFGTKFRLYSASTNLNNDLVQIQRQADSAITILESQAFKISKNDASQRQQIISAKEALGRIGEQFEELSKTTDLNEKARLEKLTNAELAGAFAYITNVAQKQLTYLQRAVKKNKDGNYPFSSEESAVYHSMITQFDRYILPSVTSTLENKKLKSKAENRILEEVKKVSQGIEKLKQTVNVDQDTYKQLLVDRLVKQLGLSADKRAFLENKVNSTQKDVNFFFVQFGNLFHSSNIFLNSLGGVVTRMDHERRQSTLEQTLPFVKKLKDLGYLAGNKIKELIKDGFIQNRFSDKVREDAYQKAKYEIYKEISGSTISEAEFIKKEDFSDLNTTQKSEMNQKISDWELENYKLTALNPEEMRERKAKYANYSPVTQNYLNVSSKFYSDLMQNAEIIDGVSTFTQDMKYDYEQNRYNQIYTNSIYDRDGNLREGIEYRSEEAYNNSLEKKEIEGQTVQLETNIIKVSTGLYASVIPGNTNNDATLAIELSQINNNRTAELKLTNKGKEFSPKFIEMLSSMEPSKAYEFLMLNAYVGYTNEYYETLDRPSIIDKLTNKLGENNDWKIEDLIQKIATTTKKMNTILQANRVMNSPSEINYDRIEKNTELPQIKEYATLLENYYTEVSSIIGRPGEEIEEDNLSETIPNDAFRAYMSDSFNINRLVYEQDILDQDDITEINKIFSEVQNNSTLRNSDKIASLRNFVRNFSNGSVNRIPDNYSKIFKLSQEDYNDMSAEQIFASMTNDLLQYSYTRLLPYFRKSQPIGADIALRELETGIISPVTFLEKYQKGEYQFLNISPNYNFQQANDQNNKNPHFQQAKIEGTPMFRTFELSATSENIKNKSVQQLIDEGKLNKFVNKEFLEDYGIDLVKLFENGQEVATKNKNKFQARQAFIELQKQTLDNYGMTNSHNVYQLPQKERTNLEKIENLLNKGRDIRGVLDEITSNREDESVLGQNVAGESFKNMSAPTIPKFGLRKLKQGIVSDQLLETYIWMNNESNLYKARVRTIGDVLSIKEALLGSQFEGNLKVEATNAYRMLEDQLKYNWFGIKETFSKEFQLFGKTADLGKILKSFGSIIRFKNLAYNITIPVTSLLTGSVQLRMEKVIGERVDASAFNRGRKRFYKEAGGAMRDVLSLESTSWLNAMGSKFGFYENEERYNNSGYGKSLRGLGRSAFVTHTIANFAPNSITALSILSDSRFVDGKVIQYRDFKENNKGKSDKEVRAIWENYKDILDVSLVDGNGVIYYDYPKIIDALNSNTTLEEVKEMMKEVDYQLAGQVKIGISAVDQQVSPVDKNLIARNAFTSFLGIHRSWLFLATQTRLKGRQFSNLSKQYEEGSWTASARVLNDIIKDIKSGKTKDVLKYIKERWETGDSTTKKNLIRGVVDFTFLNALIGLTVLGMKMLDDDDEDSYAFKLTNLFLMRTASEIASTSTALPNNIYDVLSNATVGSNIVDMAFTAPDLFSSDEVQRGRFRGMTERQRYLLRNTPGVKDLYNLYDIDNNISSYRHFNISDKEGGDNNFKWWTLYPILVDEE